MRFDMNSGYDGWSMSKRASEAYRNGERPKSKWTKKAMVEALRNYCVDMDLYYRDATDKMKKDEIFDSYFVYTGYHHTSWYCNPTDFYGLNKEVVREDFAPKTREEEMLVSIQHAEREESRAREKTEFWKNEVSQCKNALEKYRQEVPLREAEKARREAERVRQEAEKAYKKRYRFSPRSFSAYALTFPERVTYRESLTGNMWMVCHEGDEVYEVLEREAMETDCPLFSESDNALDYQDEIPVEPTPLPIDEAA